MSDIAHDALAFDCALPFGALLAAINQIGPWQWRGTESDSYGDYLWTRTPEGMSIRIFDEKTRWVFQVISARKTSTTQDDLERIFVQQIAPAIGARNIRPTESVY